MARFELRPKMFHNRKSSVFNNFGARFNFPHNVELFTRFIFVDGSKFRQMLCGFPVANAAVGHTAHDPLSTPHFDELSRFRKGVNVHWMLIGFAHNVAKSLG